MTREQATFIRFLRKHGHVGRAADQAGVNRRRVYRWASESTEFATAKALAEQEARKV